MTAVDFVELIGTSTDGQSRSGLSTDGYSIGDAGDITITTGRLQVLDGAEVSASTFGWGSGGKLTVTASNSVELIGTDANGQQRSGLFTESTIAPGALPGRGVATGDAGDLTIATGRLLVQDGAQVSASTFGPGSGGTLTVTAADEVELIGTDADGQFRSGLFTESNPPVGDARFGFIANPGDGGDLRIETRQLNVRDRAQVSVSSLGSGDAGNLDVAARKIRLENLAALTAESVQGRGGNITLQARSLLLTHNNSLISAISGGFENEGNITIDTGILAAFENSDIIANAFAGPGANIRITAQGIFGTEFRQQLTPYSDVTATGKVELYTPYVDATLGLVDLPAEPVDVTGLIAQGCSPGGGNVGKGESEFIITGRGGLPPTPSDTLSSDAIQVDWVTLNPGVENSSSPPVSTNSTAPEPAPIVEAKGWVINNYGEVVLTATAPTATPHIPWMNPVSCHTPETSS